MHARSSSRPLFSCFALLLAVVCGCGGSGGGPTGVGGGDTLGPLRLAPISTSLDYPVFLTAAPGDTARLFVLEKGGRIRVIRSGTLLAQSFLDLSARVESGALEQGLLGLAFDPRYSTNRRFYVFYIDHNRDAQLVRYQVSSNPDVAGTAAEPLLTIPHDQDTHLGGMLAFGRDGYLYVSSGDGSTGSPVAGGTAQDLTDLLGSLLRIDVSGAAGYTVPADNPFSAPARTEIWCQGLRNPWRFSFDRQVGDLYIGDVGEGVHEEIDVGVGGGRGLNFGWEFFEGSECLNPPSCGPRGVVAPVTEYTHDGGDCCVIGGHVYRGAAIPLLRGTYFYGDYCSGRVRSFRLVSGRATSIQVWSSLSTGDRITSFGEDARGELYVLTVAGGVFRIVAS